MGSTALTLCADAYREARVGTELTSFSTSQEFPYDIAITLVNKVVDDMNTLGDLYFMETDTALTYSAGVYQYDLTAYIIDPRRIQFVKRTLANQTGELHHINWRNFWNRYRQTSIQTAKPGYWSVRASQLELNCIPDQDYSLVVEHFRDQPLITATTDTFIVPANNERVIYEGVLAYLLMALEKDYMDKLSIYQNKLESMRLDMRKIRSGPLVMPAAF